MKPKLGVRALYLKTLGDKIQLTYNGHLSDISTILHELRMRLEKHNRIFAQEGWEINSTENDVKIPVTKAWTP